uniref:Uncharacterized protein n=1 Tax=Anguilla anguilla TaxID=7936 RepID=A0A0E9WEZ0_ANGAN
MRTFLQRNYISVHFHFRVDLGNFCFLKQWKGPIEDAVLQNGHFTNPPFAGNVFGTRV